MTVEHLPAKEEMHIALTTLADDRGVFLRPKEDMVRLSFLINDVFPAIRQYLDKQAEGLPVSLRLLRAFAEKLVQVKDPETNVPVYRAREKSFDRALWEVLIETYGLYENKDIVKALVSTISDIGGLFTTDLELKPEVCKYMSDDEYEKKRKAYAEKPASFEDALKKIRGETDIVAEVGSRTMPPPHIKFKK